MKWNQFAKISLLFIFLLIDSNVSAQTIDDPDETSDSESAPLNPAPIDDYIFPLLLTGVACGLIIFNKKNLLEF